MIRLNLTEIAAAVDGQLNGDNCVISNVTTDTRHISVGDLFIALVGASFDGHEFALQAKALGAAALIVEREVDCGLPQIIVADTLHALGALGAYVKAQVNPKTIAITGSNGKTTTKEMVAAILGCEGQVLATAGNFNNEIGVPLTLLRLTHEHQFAVIELGANHKGEIAYTSSLVKPNVALINNVMPAHIEGFGSIQGVAQAKSEIFSGLQDHGVAIVNGDSEYLGYWQQRVKDKSLKWFSTQDQNAHVFASNIQLDQQGLASFMLHAPQGEQQISLPVPGLHNVANALAAASLCLELGISLATIATGFGHMQCAKGRLNVLQVRDGLTVIDDTYNANLASAKAAIDLLSIYPGKQIFVVGDMGELGDEARIYHQELGEYALAKGITAVAAVGVLSLNTAEGAGAIGHYFSEKSALYTWLDAQLLSQDQTISILVKGSRSAHMEEVVAFLNQSQKAQAC
ncbi:UDP-N-acetylmuramoyl-tripeptide--D-alanyl-D-alanine ligase [Motilimonas cestriensis]|uniref:UDP-N-acetylmuramoyl-tripeptide--D-alanyl-D-alanine ligase n=1 Tax=Motilimonas cestriensis TaxID=2742685 RepID=A0ABS8WC74_9GAMM|nr:UDP-N-acetylmuramoyl-tripeptide--D-alanyl-D-alanine ligase [Motilimonas cestriensis]MCE2596095.1 UDP-N-acetylmuramoyl-tripeptide--D-alanyl-D-alanine ligase [Motilimonas cestriensis]